MVSTCMNECVFHRVSKHCSTRPKDECCLRSLKISRVLVLPIQMACQYFYSNSLIGIGNRMVSSAVWIKHERLCFSKSIKIL